MRTDTTTANDDYKGIAQLCDARICQEDSISSKLFEDEIYQRSAI
jgi:hypothetical protein